VVVKEKGQVHVEVYGKGEAFLRWATKEKQYDNFNPLTKKDADQTEMYLKIVTKDGLESKIYAQLKAYHVEKNTLEEVEKVVSTAKTFNDLVSGQQLVYRFAGDKVNVQKDIEQYLGQFTSDELNSNFFIRDRLRTLEEEMLKKYHYQIDIYM
jgi:hypothetical protein